jgi:sterol desaturase/sphingolipid hydroxylase (fatty acid hydroxylase superfamily)
MISKGRKVTLRKNILFASSSNGTDEAQELSKEKQILKDFNSIIREDWFNYKFSACTGIASLLALIIFLSLNLVMCPVPYHDMLFVELKIPLLFSIFLQLINDIYLFYKPSPSCCQSSEPDCGCCSTLRPMKFFSTLIWFGFILGNIFQIFLTINNPIVSLDTLALWSRILLSPFLLSSASFIFYSCFYIRILHLSERILNQNKTPSKALNQDKKIQSQIFKRYLSVGLIAVIGPAYTLAYNIVVIINPIVIMEGYYTIWDYILPFAIFIPFCIIYGIRYKASEAIDVINGDHVDEYPKSSHFLKELDTLVFGIIVALSFSPLTPIIVNSLDLVLTISFLIMKLALWLHRVNEDKIRKQNQRPLSG